MELLNKSVRSADGHTTEVDFVDSLYVTVNHNKGYRPLVQALTPMDGWNLNSWNTFPWNSGGNSSELIDDIDLVHYGPNQFVVTFASPTTGKIVYF